MPRKIEAVRRTRQRKLAAKGFAHFEHLENRALLSAVPAISVLKLVQARSGTTLGTLTDGMTINTAQLTNFSIEADVTSNVSQVNFYLDGTQIESEWSAPYDIRGDVSGAPNPWTPPLGSHTLVVIPVLNSTIGTSTTVHFTIVNSASTTPPSTGTGQSPVALPESSTALSGTVIGTAGSYANAGNTIANAVDGNTNTFFDAPTASGAWVGLNLGADFQVTQIQFVPRAGFNSRMVGGVFQGSNTADFSTGVTTLYTIPAAPAYNTYTAAPVTNTNGFEFVRYLSPTNGDCNVAEIQFYGVSAMPVVDTVAPDAPTLTSATAGSNNVQLNWTEDSTSIVDSFIIQREGPGNAGYVTIGTTTGTTLQYNDLTAQPSTSYSYQLIASNSIGDSNPSTPATAQTTSVPVTPTETKLTGTLIGTAGSYRNAGNTIANAVDGNLNTYFDAPTASGSWVGFDLSSAYQITQVKYVPRSGYGSRMVGGMFEGSNTADFSSGVSDLFTVTTTPANNVYTIHAVTDTGGYRYVRYLSPANGDCNVAEIEFDGVPGTATAPVNPVTPTFPTGISSWATGANSPIIRAEAVGQTVNGKVYAFGGFNNQGSDTTTIPEQSECDVYDPATNKWTRVATFPEPFTHSQGVVVGSDIWFVGGYVGNHPGPGTTHVWIYDTVPNTWTRGPDLPQARGAGAAALVDNTIYFTGGMDVTRTIDENTTYALDLSNESAGWVQKANLPNGRNHVAAASLGGYLYVMGGQHGQEEDQAPQNEVDRYDPTTNTWTRMASLPTDAGKSHITEGTLVYEGRIIVVGGETGYNDPQRYVVDYNPATNTWSQLGLLPAARSTVIAGIVNGKLIVTTGNSPDATNTTWIGTLS